ncbi:hypothetical protein Tco_0414429 [Tanacetum coccineum]
MASGKNGDDALYRGPKLVSSSGNWISKMFGELKLLNECPVRLPVFGELSDMSRMLGLSIRIFLFCLGNLLRNYCGIPYLKTQAGDPGHRGVAFSQEDAWVVLRFHPKWDAPEQVDLTGDVPGASQEDLFGHDARPPGKQNQRPPKKANPTTTASTGGSSASAQFGELMEQELRLKREAAERAFEAQAEKDRTLMRLEELRFLATSTKDLDEDDAYWIKKQKKLIKNKMKNDLGDEDDEDEDE